jgi:hypothetical protein
MSGKMAVALGSDRGKGLAAALKALGGMQAFIKPGDRVLIKVNAAFASPPAVGATTHPELLSAMIRLCQEAGAAQVLVTDNPIQDPAACFNFSGLSQACDHSGGKLILPSAGSFAALTLEGGQLLRNWPVLFGPFKGVNKLIGVAPVKDHHRGLLVHEELVRAAGRKPGHFPSKHKPDNIGAGHDGQAHPGGAGRRAEHDGQWPHRRLLG